MDPYAKDLRLKILATCNGGMPRKEFSWIFGVSEPTITSY
jgi:hypothetical protein